MYYSIAGGDVEWFNLRFYIPELFQIKEFSVEFESVGRFGLDLVCQEFTFLDAPVATATFLTFTGVTLWRREGFQGSELLNWFFLSNRSLLAHDLCQCDCL
jgi:hypothetical protein